ncbi:hypothetical protein D3C71_1185420 [compost metagenome]
MASASNQLFFQIQIVFDNTVMNDRELHAVIRMWMGILIGWFTVSCPACVSDTCATCQWAAFQLRLQIRQTALCFHYLQSFPSEYSNTSGIISPILQLLQSFNQDPLRILITNISYNTTHYYFPRPSYRNVAA